MQLSDLTVFAQRLRHARLAVIKPFIEACFTTPPDRKAVDAAYAQTTLTPTDAALSVWMAMANADRRPVLGAAVVPALPNLRGTEQDLPGDLAGWLAAAMRDAEAERFEHSGHAPFAEEPGRFNRALAGFLTG